jgi:tetratricopeptide (TPR) repeat protein
VAKPVYRIRSLHLPWALLTTQGAIWLGLPQQSMAVTPSIPSMPSSASNISLLSEKGVYWYDRYRFDLAAQSFNRILLIDPMNASALRWQGLIDLARGDVEASKIWLKKIQSIHGANHPQAVELKQLIELNTLKRQQFAELRYLGSSAHPPLDLVTRLNNLFEEPPQGEAAIQVYRVMVKTPEGRALARQRIQALINKNTEDQRYLRLLTDLGLINPEPAVLMVSNTKPNTKTSAAPKVIPTQKTATFANLPLVPSLVLAQNIGTKPMPEGVIPPTSTESLSSFDQGKALAEQAQTALQTKEYTQAIAWLQQAVSLAPNYPWFRFDLANAWMDEGSDQGKQQAKAVMDEGLSIDNTSEMRFAAALLATRQDRTADALNLLNQTPRKDWSDSMVALERRINFGQYLGALRNLERQEKFNEMGQFLKQPSEFKSEPEVKAYEKQLANKKQMRLHMGYANATIDGTPGVSRVEMLELPVQLDIPLDYEQKLFLRMDHLQVRSGVVNVANSSNFAQLGATTSTDPAIQSNRLTQNYQGHLLGIGVETNKMRLDVGTTVGDFAVNDWVGGAQWKQSIGDSTLRLELSRRMMVGSALSTTGALDPLSGQTWGAAKRNGIAAVYYTPLTDRRDFVGIAKANHITGKHIPSNNELSLQGILSQTIYKTPIHQVEIGSSLYLWSFSRNLRYYTYGQGGYYSPQSFASLALPITWTGKLNTWAWRVQAKVGISRSREDATNLYPLDPQLLASAATLGNTVEETGGSGGGTSRGLRIGLEHQLMPELVLGGLLDIDRSEGYNPNRLQMYLKYSFGQTIEFGQPPEAVAPYSRF